jgi:threonine/homoserine/homoserine lactone efflux protein
MLHVLAAALGLSLLVAQSTMTFNLVKYLGAAYLVYLGIRLLLRKDEQFTVEPVASQGARRALFEGIAVEALNVKTALFFLAFLPQFISSSEALVPQLVLLGSICVTLNTLVDVSAGATPAPHWPPDASKRLFTSSTPRRWPRCCSS